MPHRPHHKEQASILQIHCNTKYEKNINEITWKRHAYSQQCESIRTKTLNLQDNETTRFGLRLAL